MDIFIDRNSPVAPYRQLKEHIRDLVDNGDYKENQGVPSVREISRTTGVSVATVQKAFSELKQEKFIYSKAGAGYFVARQACLERKDHRTPEKGQTGQVRRHLHRRGLWRDAAGMPEYREKSPLCHH
jgi:DNA-binding transcriptional regulator YhcF (GntR family)